MMDLIKFHKMVKELGIPSSCVKDILIYGGCYWRNIDNETRANNLIKYLTDYGLKTNLEKNWHPAERFTDEIDTYSWTININLLGE